MNVLLSGGLGTTPTLAKQRAKMATNPVHPGSLFLKTMSKGYRMAIFKPFYEPQGIGMSDHLR